MEELGLRFVFWLIVFTGSLAVCYGALHLSFLLVERIIKMLGYWGLFTATLTKVANERYRKRKQKEREARG